MRIDKVNSHVIFRLLLNHKSELIGFNSLEIDLFLDFEEFS